MITRQITIHHPGAKDYQQIVLYFDSRSNAEKEPVQEQGTMRVTFEDDYKQKCSLHPATHIVNDLIIEGPRMFDAQAELNCDKLRGAKKIEDRINSDPLLKVFMESQRRDQRQKPSPMMMPVPPNLQG